MSFQKPMSYWPAIEPYAKDIVLNQSGLRLHIYDAGPQDSPAIVLVHGLGDESDSWRHIIQPLAIHQRIIAPDLPGFGRSEPLQRYAIGDIIHILIDLLDTLSISSATLLGSSLGGMFCHALAIMHPDRVQGLVFLDGHLGVSKQKLNLSTLLFMIPGIGEWRYSHYRKNPQTAYDSLRPFYASLDDLPSADREFLYQRVNERVWSNRQRKAYLGVLRNTALWLAKEQRDLEANLINLVMPTLVFYGEQDHIVSVENAHALLKLQPSARLLTLPSVGHLPQQEKPEKLLLALKNNLQLQVVL